MKKICSILLVLGLVAAVSVTHGCKKRAFDITGPWSFEIILEGEIFYEDYTFIGNINSGSVYYEGQDLGTYTVFDRTVNITLQYYDQDDDYTIETYSGYFEDRNRISGQFTIYIEGYGTFAGTFEALR